jgi:hydroxyacylglutathione hydrolase
MEYKFKNQHKMIDDIPEVEPQQVYENLDSLVLIDVRTPEEYVGELGHVPNSTLKTLGEDFDSFVHSLDQNKEYVIICRSGRRSAAATDYMRSKGFSHVYNMTGGMILWNDSNLPVEKE